MNDTPGNFFSRRWRGQIPTSILFWRDMVGVGTLINLTATFLAFVALIEGADTGLAIALHFAPMPYNLFLFAALWRAPDLNNLTAAIAAGWLVAVTFF
jgi:hypothetical protein